MSTVKNSSRTANNSLDDAFDPPPLAMRSDGKVLISIVDLADIDLGRRERWTGVVLTPAEAAALYRRCHFEEAASTIVGSLRAADRKAKPVKRAKRRVGNE